VDKYIPLDPEGFRHARNLKYIDEHDPPNGNMCLECGAIVASRWLHDNWHWAEDKEED